MGRTNVILDIKVLRDNDCIILSQTYYVEKMFKRFEHFDYLSMSTPYDSKNTFGKESRWWCIARKVCTIHW
jgi:hypothetical protein